MILVKVDGCDGNVKAQDHDKWIMANKLRWNVSRSIATKTGGGQDREQGPPTLSAVTFTKTLDTATPKLFSEACTGKGKKVQIHIVKTADGSLQTFMEYTLENCLVSGYAVQAEGTETEEEVTLNFTKMEMKFTPWEDPHTPGSPVTAGYDVTHGKKV